MIWGWLIAYSFSVFTLGHLLAKISERSYIKMVADQNTAMYIGGEFYYIVPEKKYVAMSIFTQQAVGRDL